MKALIYILSLFILSIYLPAKELNNILYVDVSVDSYSYKGDFKNLGGNPDCCPDKRSGSGISPSINFVKPLTLFGQPLNVTLGLSLLSGKIEYQEKTAVLLDNTVNQGIFLHELDFDIVMLDFGIEKKFDIDDFQFGIGLGTHLWITSDYDQKEILINPANRGVFSDTKTRIRNQYSGAIPNSNTFIPFLRTNISYQIIRPTEDQFLSLKPFINAELPMLSMLRWGSWTYFKIGLGISLSFKK